VTWVLGGQRADIRGAEHKGGHMASLGGPPPPPPPPRAGGALQFGKAAYPWEQAQARFSIALRTEGRPFLVLDCRSTSYKEHRATV
jgi:hypothetical protein